MAILTAPQGEKRAQSQLTSWKSLPSVEFTRHGGCGGLGEEAREAILEEILAVKGETLVTLRLPWESLLVGKAQEWNEHKHRRALDAVIHLTLTAHLGRKEESGGFVPVPFNLITEIAGDHYGRDAAKLLLALGILETDGRYTPGEKSLGYRLSPAALSWGFRIVDAPLPIARALADNRRRRSWDSIRARPHYLTVWNVLRRVTLADTVWPAIIGTPIGPDDLVKGLCRLLATDCIHSERWFFRHDDETGRCFTNVTNYPKALRPHLLIGGEATAEADIANAQPLMLGALAYPTPSSLEARKYLELVTGGSFYETLADWAGVPEMPREEAKKATCHLLFGRRSEQTAFWPAVATHFPQLAAFILKAKDCDYRRLAVSLQTREAEIMLGGVVPRLAGEGFEAHPIHDGVLAKSADIEHVQRIVAEEVEAATGVRPLVRVKR